MEGVGTLSWLSAEAVLLKWSHPAGSPVQTGVLSTCSWAVSASGAIIQNNGSLGPIGRLPEGRRKQELEELGQRGQSLSAREVKVKEQHTHHLCSLHIHAHIRHTHLSNSGTDEHGEGL